MIQLTWEDTAELDRQEEFCCMRQKLLQMVVRKPVLDSSWEADLQKKSILSKFSSAESKIFFFLQVESYLEAERVELCHIAISDQQRTQGLVFALDILVLAVEDTQMNHLSQAQPCATCSTVSLT